MPIKISKTLIDELPQKDRENIEKVLKEKSKGFCYLCEEPFNWAADPIEADHDLPRSEGGKTEIPNLNLAHADCNRAKKNAKTVPVRPYLKLRAYMRKHGPLLKYDGVLAHFQIEPKPTIVERSGDSATIHLVDGPAGGVTLPIYSETNLSGTFEYVFLELPRSALYNDDQVQPRTIKEGHSWKIYVDLQHNPLNEPPSARAETTGGSTKILLFDGQHKTVASWMLGRQKVATKLYLNMTEKQARQLVNSVQSGVPKLPLSPFEIAAKMEEEWRDRLEQYEAAVGETEVSEAGFFKWLPQIDRARARAAFREARIQSILDQPNLGIKDFVKRPNAPSRRDGLAITEAALKNKLFMPLIRMEPLPAKGEALEAYRAIERENAAFLLNTFVGLALTPQPGEAEMSPGKLAAANRMLYQASLSYIADLLLKIFKRATMVDELGASQTTDVQKDEIQLGVGRVVAHPVWTEPYGRDSKMASVKDALEKNQEAKRAFEGVALDLSWAIVGEDSAAFQNYWRS